MPRTEAGKRLLAALESVVEQPMWRDRIDAIEAEAATAERERIVREEEASCVPARDADAATVGLDWCRKHDSRWDLNHAQCDKGSK